MADRHDDIMRHIDDLVAEERGLRDRSTQHMGLTEAEQHRLHEVEVQLDRYWDLLRQRRARAQYGQNPEGAHLRGANQVEGYQN
jgi:hypothetical protein